MNRKTDNEQLLADVLAETAPPDFRGAMLGETLRSVRRRRRARQARRAVGIFIALGLLGIFIRQENLPQPGIVRAPIAKKIESNYKLVRTKPLPANSIVGTQPLDAGQFASAAGVKIVETTAGNFRALNDEELLALISPRPAILIRTGKNSERLVFANSTDEKGFPVN